MDEMNERHKAAMDEMQNASRINIHGKAYSTVATRAQIFRKHFGVLGRLRVADFTETDGRLQMRAVVELLGPSGWIEVAEGRAEEKRDSSPITKTSAIEVCETSAYGRALANFGLHGGEFASANEVENAVAKQKTLGDRSGRPDTSNVDPELRDQYVQDFAKALLAFDDAKIVELQKTLSPQAELFTAVWDQLNSKQRAEIRKIVESAKKVA